MTYDKGKKWFSVILLTFLVPAIAGSYGFLPNETFCFAKFNTNRLDTAGFFPSIAHTVDWLAEDITTISKAEYSPSPLRNVLFRVFTLAGINITAASFSRPCFQITRSENSLIIKSNIPLKLRI